MIIRKHCLVLYILFVPISLMIMVFRDTAYHVEERTDGISFHFENPAHGNNSEIDGKKVDILNFTKIKRLNIDLSHQLSDIPPSFLTLITTTREIPYCDYFTHNTIKNWAYLSPWIIPVLFVKDVFVELQNNASCGYIARQYGWKVLQYHHTINGLPVLKTMILESANLGINAPFIGYADAEMLFDKNILHTLFQLKASVRDITKKTIFVSGQKVSLKQELMMAMPDAAHPTHVALLAAGHKYFEDRSADYFIFSQAGFRWDRVPDFVIGQAGYDLWLMSAAVQWNIIYLDASETILAVQQTGSVSSHRTESNLKNQRLNYDMMDPKFPLDEGFHYCAPFFSLFEKPQGPTSLDTLKIMILTRNYRSQAQRKKRCAQRKGL